MGHAKKCVEQYCELANRTTQQLYKISTPSCIDRAEGLFDATATERSKPERSCSLVGTGKGKKKDQCNTVPSGPEPTEVLQESKLESWYSKKVRKERSSRPVGSELKGSPPTVELERHRIKSERSYCEDKVEQGGKQARDFVLRQGQR